MTVEKVDDGFGIMYIGAMITMAMYGLTTLQTYFYFINYPKDSYGLKVIVSILWVLDTIHIVLMNKALYHYLISGFGNFDELEEGTWPLFTSIALNVTMALIVQCFFTKRIHQLSPPRAKWWFSSIIGFFVVAHFCFGIETVVLFFIRKELSRLVDVQFEAALPFAIAAIVSDILIAAALCVLLHRNRSRFSSTNNIINTLIVFAINRCILTSAVAILEVILFLALKSSFYTFATDFIIGKLYVNSLLATLNSRRSIRSRSHRGSTIGLSDVSSFRIATATTGPGDTEATDTSLNTLRVRIGGITSDDDQPDLQDYSRSRDEEASVKHDLDIQAVPREEAAISDAPSPIVSFHP